MCVNVLSFILNPPFFSIPIFGAMYVGVQHSRSWSCLSLPRSLTIYTVREKNIYFLAFTIYYKRSLLLIAAD